MAFEQSGGTARHVQPRSEGMGLTRQSGGHMETIDAQASVPIDEHGKVSVAMRKPPQAPLNLLTMSYGTLREAP